MKQQAYYTVTQVCTRLNVQPHVLRYWEREFELKVKRNSAGRRIYSGTQLERLRIIRHLLHQEKLTVKGARRQLARMRSEPQQVLDLRDYRQALLWLKKELFVVRGLLANGAPDAKGR